jgi:hypothetical protein
MTNASASFAVRYGCRPLVSVCARAPRRIRPRPRQTSARWPTCAHAANIGDVAGSDVYVVGIGTDQPANAIETGTGEVKAGSSEATCVRAIEGAVSFAGKKLVFCDSEGWRGASTAFDHP